MHFEFRIFEVTIKNYLLKHTPNFVLWIYKIYFNKTLIAKANSFTYIKSQRNLITTTDIISCYVWNTSYATGEEVPCGTMMATIWSKIIREQGSNNVQSAMVLAICRVLDLCCSWWYISISHLQNCTTIICFLKLKNKGAIYKENGFQ